MSLKFMWASQRFIFRVFERHIASGASSLLSRISCLRVFLAEAPRTNYVLQVILVLLLTWVGGCSHGDNGDGESPPWQVSTLWPRGSRPMPSPDGRNVLFTQEESPAGLYMLREYRAAVHLNPSGPEARTDYVWDADGSRFSFSSPGLPGSGDAGIYLSSAAVPSTFSKLWDRGSDPYFLPQGNSLLCAGPLSDTSHAGIWQIELDSRRLFRVTQRGFLPKASPDGIYISYLIPTFNPENESWLAVLDRRDGSVDTLMAGVVDYDWLSPSQKLVVELRTVDTHGEETQSISVLDRQSASAQFVAYGTTPDAFPNADEFTFTGIVADRLDGVFISSLDRAAYRIHARGAHPVSSELHTVVAQDSVGLILMTRRVPTTIL